MVHRAWHPGQSREFGAFWSLEEPTGSLKSRIDSALLPEWGGIRDNPLQRQQATRYTTAIIPKGARVYLGKVGAQGGPWVGGATKTGMFALLFEVHRDSPALWSWRHTG